MPEFRHFFRRIFPPFLALILLISPSPGLSGCGSADGSAASGTADSASSGTPRTTTTEPLMPEAPGTQTVSNEDESITLDYSNTSEGYIMIRDTNDTKVQIQITNPNGEIYPYPLASGGVFKAFPLTEGDGTYQVSVLENISGDNYAIGLSKEFQVTLNDEFRPFLYPNQYVDYSADSEAVKLGESLSKDTSTDLEYVQSVYNYVTENISYDDALAANTPTNYIPDVDTTLSTKKGICFDYAALMTCMLRSQMVPTKLEVGYSGNAYHAWISVYLKETGWVDNIISFDGKDWTLMDPTLGANNDADAVKKYIGDGSNYTTKYTY